MIQRSAESKDRIQYGSTNIEYYIKRSKRIKTSELIVDPDRIEIRTPLNKSQEDTRNIVLDKADWILRKQNEYRNSVQEIIKPTFNENSTLPYLGKNYPLWLNKNKSRIMMRFVKGKFVVDITSSDVDEDTKSEIGELYEGWLEGIAYEILKKRAEIYAERVGVNVYEISIKNNLRSRWASLTRKGAINFNMHLIKAPQDVVDYIVLHEICHLKIKGHSHHYWDLLYSYMPNYQEKLDWLNVNGRALINADEKKHG